MDWIDSLNGDGFRAWLTELTAAYRISERKLDPFATSARRPSKWVGPLEGARHTPLVGQSRTDLRAAGMVDDAGNLTDLAERVLAKWNDYGLHPTTPTAKDKDLDVARALILVREGVGSKPYDDFIEFWREVRKAIAVDTLLQSPELLMLVGYLDQEQAGFNPWKLIRTQDSLVAVEPDWAVLGQKLEGRTDVSRRGRNRIAFCQALELSLLTAPEGRAAVARWGLSADAVAALEPLLKEAPTTAHSDELEKLVLDRHNVIFYGPPGTGKTWAALAVARRWRHQHGPNSVFPVTFHPSYSYEDFVQGFRPDPEQPGQFRLQDGVLLHAAKAAEKGPVLLFIDEINRGDTARIFGELITYIEPDKRSAPFRLAQSPGETRTLSPQLYLLGTMNTADRSVSLLDTAMRRRFAFVGFPPDGGVFASNPGWAETVAGVSLATLLGALNQRLERVGVDADRAIGHALLAVDAGSGDGARALYDRFRFDIHPLVLEYCALDRKGAGAVLGKLVDARGELLPYDEQSFSDALADLT